MPLSKRNKYLLIAISPVIIVYTSFCFRESKQMKDMAFCGIVQNVQYNIKGGATLMILYLNLHQTIGANYSATNEMLFKHPQISTASPDVQIEKPAVMQA